MTTEQTDGPTLGERDRPVFEITEEIIKAGADWLEGRETFSQADLAEGVFEVMAAAGGLSIRLSDALRLKYPPLFP